jgi:hypothetical protein
MKKILRMVNRSLPLLLLFVASIATLAIARIFIAPANFYWPAWVQAVGSIAAIVGAFLVASQQHVAERSLEQEKARDEEIRRFQAVQALGANTGGFLAGGVAAADNLYFAYTPPGVLVALDDSAKAFQSLPIFDLPHEALVIYCTSLPLVLKRIHSLLEKQNAYLDDPQRHQKQGINIVLLESEYEIASSFVKEIGDLCKAEIDRRRTR